MRQSLPMLKPTGSKSEPKPVRQSFVTIDDCVNQAEDLFTGLRRLSQIKYPLDIRRGIKKGVEDIMDDNSIGRQLKASGRTYFFDLEQTREGKTYLRITESRKGKDDKFERNSILVFPEDAGEFAQVVSKIAAKLG